MNKISNVTKISVAILSISHRFHPIFVEASHHQDVWPLCDEPWTPLAGLRGLSFSINNGVHWSWSLQQGGSHFCMLDMICTTWILAYHQWWHIASQIQLGNRSFLISDGLLAKIVIFFLNWHTQNLYSFGVELLESAPKVRVIHAMRCRNTLLGRHMDCSIENL